METNRRTCLHAIELCSFFMLSPNERNISLYNRMQNWRFSTSIFITPRVHSAGLACPSCLSAAACVFLVMFTLNQHQQELKNQDAHTRRQNIFNFAHLYSFARALVWLSAYIFALHSLALLLVRAPPFFFLSSLLFFDCFNLSPCVSKFQLFEITTNPVTVQSLMEIKRVFFLLFLH